MLVDEINRAMPKTQSALLEAMAEHQVTVDGVTRQLPDPFLLIATENPIEYEGTFPLPEAQLDRFFLRTSLGYPGEEEEIQIVREQRHGHPLDGLGPAVTMDEIARAPPRRRGGLPRRPAREWIVDLVRATRELRRGRGRRLGARLARAREDGARLGAAARARPRAARGRRAALHPRARPPADAAPAYLAETRNLTRDETLEQLQAQCLERVPRAAAGLGDPERRADARSGGDAAAVS